MPTNSSFQKAINCLALLDFSQPNTNIDSVTELANSISAEIDALADDPDFERLGCVLALQMKTLQGFLYQKQRNNGWQFATFNLISQKIKKLFFVHWITPFSKVS